MAGIPSVGGRPPGRFLEGDVRWWVPPLGKPFSKERRQEEVVDYRRRRRKIISALGKKEATIPDGLHLWRRQRLRPLGLSMLYPTSFSLGFIFFSLVLLLLSIAGYSEYTFSVLSAAIANIILCVFWLKVLNRRMESVPDRALDVTLIILFLVVAPLTYIALEPFATNGSSAGKWFSIGIIAILSLIYGVQLRIVIDGVTYSGARFLLPVGGDVGIVKWEACIMQQMSISKGPVIIAEGLRFQGQKFVSLSFQPRSFLPRKDPLSIDNSEVVKSKITGLMGHYLPIAGEWPQWAEPNHLGEEE